MAISRILANLQPSESRYALNESQIKTIEETVQLAVADFLMLSEFEELSDFCSIIDTTNGFCKLLDDVRPPKHKGDLVQLVHVAPFVAHFIDQHAGEQSGKVRQAFANTIIRARKKNGGNRKSDTWGKTAVEVLIGRTGGRPTLQVALRSLVEQGKAENWSKAKIKKAMADLRASYRE